MRRDDDTLEDSFVDFVRTKRPPQRMGTVRFALGFSDFGVPVPVTAPPASEVYFEH